MQIDGRASDSCGFGRRPELAADRQRVDDEAQAAEEQDLNGRLAERVPGRIDLGQGERQHERPGRSPLPPGQPTDEAAEREHGQTAEDRVDHRPAARAGRPEPASEQHRQAGRYRRENVMTVGDEPDARQVQARMRTAERRQRAGNRQRAVLGDPVAGLKICTWRPRGDDRWRIRGKLPDGEAGGDRDRADDPEPSWPAAFASLPRQVGRPLAGHLGEQVDRERGQQGRGDEQHRDRRECPSEQQRQARHQPGDDRDRGQDGKPGEPAAGPLPTAGGALAARRAVRYRVRLGMNERERQRQFRPPRPQPRQAHRHDSRRGGGRPSRTLLGGFRATFRPLGACLGSSGLRLRGTHANHCMGRAIIHAGHCPARPN